MTSVEPRRRCRRSIVLAAAACAAAVLTLNAARSGVVLAEDPPTVYVTSTADGPPTACKGSRHCTLRDAIETVAQTGRPGRIVARFCGPTVPGPYCLGEDDPNFYPAAHVWRIPLVEPFGFDITGTQVTIDFSAGVPDWHGAADNVVEVDTGKEGLDWAFGMDGTQHILRGFNLRGDVKTAQVVVYNGATEVTLDALAFAAVTGDAIRIRDERTANNRVFGAQCGWFGAKPTGGAALPPTPVTGTCVEVSRGAHDNWIGEEGSGPNVFADAKFGVHVTGRGTRANKVRASRLDGNGVGIRVSAEALNTQIERNTIVRSAGNGIEIAGASWQTVIADNRIGVEADELPSDETLPNEGWGIDIAAPAKDSIVRGNRIQGNGAGGIRVAGRTAQQHSFTENRITGHAGVAIAVEGGGNGGIVPPELHVAGTRIVGRACPQCDVQFFTDPADEAAAFEGTVAADNNGNVIFAPTEALRHRYVTALATDPDGNSSALSAPLDMVPGPTPTATAVGPVVRGRAYLPVGWRGQP